MYALSRRRFLQAATLAAVQIIPVRAMVREPQSKPDSDELAVLDALGQAELVRQKKISPLELVDSAIARIEKFDPTLNSIITRTFERARKQASQPVGSGPFAGVPYLVKDLEPVAGVRQTFGAGAFKGERRDLHLRNYSADGAGRADHARQVEHAGVWTAASYRAAGVRSDEEPLERGSLAGRFERRCGGRGGRWPRADRDGQRWRRIDSHSRVVLRTVWTEDQPRAKSRVPRRQGRRTVGHSLRRPVPSATALPCSTPPAARLPASAGTLHPRNAPYLQEVGAPPGRLRIAFTTKNFAGKPVHPDCVKAVESTAKLCEELGHTVEEAAPQFDGRLFGESFLVLWAAVAGRAVKTANKLSGGKVTVAAFEPWTQKLVEWTRSTLRRT